MPRPIQNSVRHAEIKNLSFECGVKMRNWIRRAISNIGMYTAEP